MKTQKQRSAERRRKDREDYKACMERESWVCQRCGAPATQMHHGKRKHLLTRHYRKFHYALCFPCHDWAHRNVAWWNQWMNDNPNKGETT